MIAARDASTVLDRQLLLQLGERLKRLRRSQGLSAAALADRVGISRTTLAAVEAGDPGPSMGNYLRVMSALGVSADLALLAGGLLQGMASDSTQHSRRAAPKVTLRVPAAGGAHALQDLQSLMLHKEAVRLMRQDPALVQQALQTLERWRSDPSAHARVLWDEWSVILNRRDWRRALSTSKRAKELRQASPLPGVLPPALRAEVLAQVQSLKKDLVLGGPQEAQDAETLAAEQEQVG